MVKLMFLPLLFHLLLCQEVPLKFYHVVTQQGTGNQDLTTWWLMTATQKDRAKAWLYQNSNKIRSGHWIIKKDTYWVFHCTTHIYDIQRLTPKVVFSLPWQMIQHQECKNGHGVGNTCLYSFPPSYVQRIPIWLSSTDT